MSDTATKTDTAEFHTFADGRKQVLAGAGRSQRMPTIIAVYEAIGYEPHFDF